MEFCDERLEISVGGPYFLWVCDTYIYFVGFSGELLVDDLTCLQQGRGSVEVRIFRVTPLRDVTLCHDDFDQEDYWLWSEIDIDLS